MLLIWISFCIKLKMASNIKLPSMKTVLGLKLLAYLQDLYKHEENPEKYTYAFRVPQARPADVPVAACAGGWAAPVWYQPHGDAVGWWSPAGWNFTELQLSMILIFMDLHCKVSFDQFVIIKCVDLGVFVQVILTFPSRYYSLLGCLIKLWNKVYQKCFVLSSAQI